MRRALLLIPVLTIFVTAGAVPSQAAAGPWERCGTVQTRFIAFYEVKAKRSSCKSAAKVARKWNRRLLKQKCEYTSCTSLGYRCTATNIKQTRYYTAYTVKCKRGIKRVNWKISLD